MNNYKRMMRYIKYVVVLFCVFAFASVVIAKQPARVIAGWVENVTIELQSFKVKAKLDTGAKTSSIHALNIESFKKDGERWVRFDLPLRDKHDNEHRLTLEKPRARKTNIKNHDGEHDKRYVVELEVCFNGNRHLTEFTLADRSEYIYNILLGRTFLQKVAIIDPNNTFLTLGECK